MDKPLASTCLIWLCAKPFGRGLVFVLRLSLVLVGLGFASVFAVAHGDFGILEWKGEHSEFAVIGRLCYNFNPAGTAPDGFQDPDGFH